MEASASFEQETHILREDNPSYEMRTAFGCRCSSEVLPLLLHKPHPGSVSQLFVQVPTYFFPLLLGKQETQYPDRLVCWCAVRANTAFHHYE